MTVHLWDHNLTHVAVPGMACTSIKHAFFEIENARLFKDYLVNGKTSKSIRSIRPTPSRICRGSGSLAIRDLA